MLTREQIVRLLKVEPPIGISVAITGITEDSRRVAPGTIFAAVPGEHRDGHDFAEQAVRAGAVLIMGARTNISELHGLPYWHVERPRHALGVLAHALAGDPSRAMTVVAFTGTNGKSSSVTLTQHVLQSLRHRAACFGTLGYDIPGQHIPAKHTTPFAEELADIFARARDAGVTHVAMEVSSHALDQDRVAGIEFDVGVFTNCTQDHLDYHADLESYCRAKLRLFELIEGPGRFTVVNADDPRARQFIAASKVPCYTFGHKADCHAQNVQHCVEGTRFDAVTPWGHAEIAMRLVGNHNVANTLGVVTVCGGLGLPLPDVAAAIGTLARVPGRFERVDAGQDFLVIVDYAHTEDGLRNVLTAARQISSGRLIVVFGCGGDRDRTKRPKMAAAAAELADFSIITSDNPRTEEPKTIMLEIEKGMIASGKTRDQDYWMIVDRAEAIGRAIRAARSGDVVLIAGKGHEDYQIFGANRIHFDDREVARAVLERRR